MTRARLISKAELLAQLRKPCVAYVRLDPCSREGQMLLQRDLLLHNTSLIARIVRAGDAELFNVEVERNEGARSHRWHTRIIIKRVTP